MNSEVTAVSDLLKQARKAQGLTIKAVAQEICVQTSYLKAIEAGEYEKLPAPTFAVGFVRSYAAALGEDADSVVTCFKTECGISKPAAPAVPGAQASKVQRKIPGWLSPIAGLVGASLCWAVLGGSFSSTVMVADGEADIANERAQLAALRADGSISLPVVDNIDPVHNSLEVEEARQSVTPPTEGTSFLPAAYAEPEKAATSAKAGFLLQASEDSWVRVARPDGTELWSGILRAGQTYRPYEAGEMLLTTSNAGGLVLKGNDPAEVPLGQRGEILKRYPLGEGSQLTEDIVSAVAVGSR